ncbi:ABC transporter ATP-binding protein [Treponema sp. OMZ 840]|uniref:ABC transporter ATP-binding protein n=1 Tax=Treponema sp. OMZ 840 TaxID=244313 RepID=UPI003D92CD8D
MSYVEIIGLQKTWPEIKIDFSCSIERAKMLGIAGHSGSGKSTVLRLIAGLIQPDSEKSDTPFVLSVGGKSIKHMSPAKRGLGMVFQNAALFPHMRVDDNVAYGLRCTGMGKKQSRRVAAEFLKNFALEGFAERYPESLSGGEAQRVSLARTLIVRPSLVLFDEPFSSLDAPLRKKLASDIRDLQKKIGFTGIIVTHDINEAKAMCDHITVLKKGRQTWTGSPEDFSEAFI